MVDVGRAMDEPHPNRGLDLFRKELQTSALSSDTTLGVADHLCRACVRVLPVDGAGLSFGLSANGRVPLGASDKMAALAERLQFATGTGPCSMARLTRTAVLASQVEIQARWPGYAAQLAEHTDYRSTVSVPVTGPLSGAVVLDLYIAAPERPDPDLLDDVRPVAAVIGAELAADFAAKDQPALGLPAALTTAPATARQLIWVAVGMLTHRHQVDSGTALALLRGMALARGLDMETTAERVVGGELDD